MKDKIIQMDFDIKIPKETTNEELESLFSTIENSIEQFVDINGKSRKFTSIGVFNLEDITQQYKENFSELLS